MTNYRQTAARALAKCAANDPWFPQPNRATVDAWAEHIAEYKLGEADVLQGVKIAYRDHGAGFRPLPRDVIQAARQVRRERAEAESDAERQEREDRHDQALEVHNRARLGDVIDAIGHRIPDPAPAPLERNPHNPLTVECGWCKAWVGHACTNAGKATAPHPSRVEALQAAAEGAA
ncbi:zinc finger domain-containing protein [Mycobacterium colombiense]